MAPAVSVADVPRISIFTGRFGTGKTEVAINYALALAELDGSVTLTDMDVVTPYFRTRDMTERLKPRGVEVVAPADFARDIHLTAVSARIWGTLQNEDGFTVMDVGGDSQGTRAIGQFKALIERSGYIMYLVVNPYRPFNATVERIAQTVADIEANSRLETGALVSNPNLIADTTLQIVQDGHRLVEQAGEELGLPIAFLCVEERLLEGGVEDLCAQPILPLARHFLPPWEE
ncbi:MAG TPA: hypothetical protein VM075_05835 [Anaerolineae bacterium]|nr:hypothetical protein [Anaerolineae bacterium]